jgi:predicted transcriptional regulator
MKTIWCVPQKNVTVREIHNRMKTDGQVAYTTVMSTMDTLHKKGLLRRKIAKGRGGLYYVYWPSLGQEGFEKSAVYQVLDSLTRNFGDTVASYLTERVTAVDKEKLRTLTKPIARTKEKQ